PRAPVSCPAPTPAMVVDRQAVPERARARQPRHLPLAGFTAGPRSGNTEETQVGYLCSLVPHGHRTRTALSEEDPILDSGDTAFVLVAAALVMFMTPGLALFYGGMVRAKKVLGTVIHK